MNFSPYKYDEYIIESFENKPLKKSSTVRKMKWRNFVHPQIQYRYKYIETDRQKKKVARSPERYYTQREDEEW